MGLFESGKKEEQKDMAFRCGQKYELKYPIRSRIFWDRSREYDIRSPKYDNRSPKYDDRSPKYDNRSREYDIRSREYDIRSRLFLIEVDFFSSKSRGSEKIIFERIRKLSG